MSESDIVIRAEGLGKRYQLGQGVDLTRTFREAVMDFPRKLKRLAGGRSATRPVATPAAVPGNDPPDPDTPPGTFWALRDVNFEIKRGEVVGIIGRNGAGKSTLLKVLSRITWPTKGRAELRGRLASLLEVGTGFHPELTGRENIFLNGAILGMRKQEIASKFDEIVAFAEIERFLDTPVKRYSSGMYVRLAFAVAAHLEPEILIVDEVLAVGDAAFQKKCLGRMNDVAKGGRTVLFVSHNMAAVQALCSRVVLLNEGRIQVDTTPSLGIRQYMQLGTDRGRIVHDLSVHPGRRHAKHSIIREAWLEHGNGEKTSSAMMGESIAICFRYDCAAEPVSNCVFGFGIEDESGRRIFSLNNMMSGDPPSSEPKIRGIARLRLRSLNLMPGSYLVSLSMTISSLQWVDFIEQAFAFEVLPADVYASGKIPEAAHGIVYADGYVVANEDDGVLQA